MISLCIRFWYCAHDLFFFIYSFSGVFLSSQLLSRTCACITEHGCQCHNCKYLITTFIRVPWLQLMGFIYLQSAMSAVQVGNVDIIMYKTASYMLSRRHCLPIFSVDSIKIVGLCPVSTKNVLYYLRSTANHTPRNVVILARHTIEQWM